MIKSLKIISDKMQETQLNQLNEKIVIEDGSKEINLLIRSYNNMVDKLEESATILAHDCMTADAYATACMVMGLEQSLELCRVRNDIEGYFIYDDHGALKTVWSDGFPIQQDKWLICKKYAIMMT